MKYSMDKISALSLMALMIIIPCMVVFLRDDKKPYDQFVLQKMDTVIVNGYYFQNMVDTIKKYEGFCAEPCYCLSKDPYIGYGHRNYEGISRVSKKQADSILRSDLKYLIRLAHRYTGKSGNKALAIAGLMYCIGPGSFARSTLCEMINAGEDVDDMWEAYGNINGEPNKRLRKRLSYSKKLYNE